MRRAVKFLAKEGLQLGTLTLHPTYFQTFEEYEAKKRAIPDPTSLIVVGKITDSK